MLFRLRRSPRYSLAGPTPLTDRQTDKQTNTHNTMTQPTHILSTYSTRKVVIIFTTAAAAALVVAKLTLFNLFSCSLLAEQCFPAFPSRSGELSLLTSTFVYLIRRRWYSFHWIRLTLFFFFDFLSKYFGLTVSWWRDLGSNRNCAYHSNLTHRWPPSTHM